jgi:7-cyano-7-deazaguanine synthase in queuosine biosynthesis
MKQVLLLNSGGLDSAMLAKKLQTDGFDVHSLYIDFVLEDSRPTSLAAEETAKRYCVDHKVVTLDLGISTDHMNNISMLAPSIGVAYAKLLKIMEVYVGTTRAVDEAFADRYNEINQGRTVDRVKPQVYAPLFGLGVKMDTAAACDVNDITEFSYTHSCRKEIPDGTCVKCLYRADLGI